MAKLGFIGAGELGSAIIGGIVKSGVVKPSDINVFEINKESAQKVKSKFNINIIETVSELAKSSEIVILAVKPFIVAEVAKQIKESLTEDKIVVSVAAGVTTDVIEEIIGKIPVVRVLTNTPAFIQEAMTIIAKGKFASDKELNEVEKIFASIGKTSLADESLMDVATAISGSGPAFYYELANAFALSCEKLGYEKKEAVKISAQTMLGAAKMLLNSPKTPEELIGEVTTPGGCTIVGLETLRAEKIEQILDKTLVDTVNKAAILAKR